MIRWFMFYVTIFIMRCQRYDIPTKITIAGKVKSNSNKKNLLPLQKKQALYGKY